MKAIHIALAFIAIPLWGMLPKGFLVNEGSHRIYPAHEILSALRSHKISEIEFKEKEISAVAEELSYAVIDGAILTPKEGIIFRIATERTEPKEKKVSFSGTYTDRIQILEHISENHEFYWYIDEHEVILIPIEDYTPNQQNQAR